MTKQYQLPREFGEKWVEALRSGEYKQGRETLHDEDTDCYCCLGVAAKICGYNEDMINRYDVLEKDRGFEAVGVPQVLIRGTGNDELIDTLTSANDGYTVKQLSFPEIADWIETNVEFI